MGTRRRLRSSRLVLICPARSQRRSVSTLTPIAFAASPSDMSAIAGTLAREPDDVREVAAIHAGGRYRPGGRLATGARRGNGRQRGGGVRA